ncbi:D-alanyl-D-alanine endopeptidase [Accumulibacter sp.]|uniref:D-alanyl-D-alanine endopeptidase n=1 Tax=Accumulibacter sp. TaxID=2053492 RepID=UPI0028C48DF7|nr:D-alanyl-D-alanine endopeptidase [Accumulibacter sp.]
MRMMLRAVMLLGALMGTGLMSMEAAHAADKAKSKAELHKSKAAATKKEKAAPKASKSKSKSTRVARSSKSASPVAKSKYAPVGQKKKVSPAFASDADLWQDHEHLAVRSGSALVIAQDSGQALYEKNARAVVPIASITKIMTAMVVLDSMPDLQAPITITDDDVDYLKGSRSRLQVGTVLTRERALLLALMSSENRAANALGRHYPGGLPAFVAAMNRKAASLGMARTHFEDPTGLTSNNVATAHDLARMVAAAYRYPLIREFSTTSGATAEVRGRELEYRNTNQLVKSPTWEIGLSKTGYIQEAGKCLVMQATVADKPVVIVLLDSVGKQTRIGDAIRIKRWMESASVSGKPSPA